MNKLFIMTWNTELYVEKTLMPICEKYKSVVYVVKKYLENDNAICFLQEIPYCSNETWKVHTLFEELKRDFPKNKYDIVYNITTKKQIMMTVAIAKVGIIEKSTSSSFNDNRTVTIKHKNASIRITGIHAKNGKENSNYLKHLNACSSDIILGDFNAGDYEESENRNIFNDILKGYTCICNEITRRSGQGRSTPIDHVFVKTELLPECTICEVHEKIVCSDHYPITFAVKIKLE